MPTPGLTDIREQEATVNDQHPDEVALHRTYDAYVTQGMEDHEHGSLRPDDFINRLLNAGVVVRLASSLAAAERADPYPDHARMDAYAQGYNDASRDAALSAASE